MGCQKSDPTVSSVYCHHYSVDTYELCSLMVRELCLLSVVEFGPILLLVSAEDLVACCFPADVDEQLSQGRSKRTKYRTNPATWRASPFCSHY